MESWQLFFDIGREIGQITGDFKVEDVVKNDLVDTANNFDAAKVKADADGFQLSEDYKVVDVEAIRAAL
jgi:NitT/TauT family transport system substrate-binding protein